MHSQGIKKPASKADGLKGLQIQFRLERNLSAKQDSASNASGKGGIGESVEGRPVAGVFHKRVNAGEVEVVKHIQHGRAELERGPLRQLDPLVDGEVANVRDGVLADVARYVAERRAEERLRLSAVHDEVNVVLGHDDRLRSGVDALSLVQRIEADQGVGGGWVEAQGADRLSASQGEEEAGVLSKHAHGVERGIYVAEERTGHVNAVEGADPGGIVIVTAGSSRTGARSTGARQQEG